MAGLLFASDFDLRVDEATSEMIPGAEPDVALNLELSDLVRSRQVAPRAAVRALRRRLLHTNPNVRLLALALTDTCAKNAGLPFLREMVSREFVDVLVALCGPAQRGGVFVHDADAVVPQNPAVAARAQPLVVEWAALCAPLDGLQYIAEAVSAARRSGVPLPPAPCATLPIADTVAPPEWTDSAACERCRDAFTLMQRKHHCRRCGRTFCQSCSSRVLALPELGLAAAVRVCETCYAERTDPSRSASRAVHSTLPEAPAAVAGARADPELAAAIKMSLSQPEAYDEDAAVAAAIKASLQDVPGESAPSTERGASPQAEASPHGDTQPVAEEDHMALTPMERENVVLFAEVVKRVGARGVASDPDLGRLAADMAAVRARLLSRRASDMSASAARDAERVLAMLNGALGPIDALPVPGGALSVPGVQRDTPEAEEGAGKQSSGGGAAPPSQAPAGPSCPDTFHMHVQRAKDPEDRPLIEL